MMEFESNLSIYNLILRQIEAEKREVIEIYTFSSLNLLTLNIQDSALELQKVTE